MSKETIPEAYLQKLKHVIASYSNSTAINTSLIPIKKESEIKN